MSDERGFTLIELVMGMTAGLVLLFASLAAVDSFATSQRTVEVRSDNTQRARLKLDELVRALRSQACTGPTGPSIQAGSPSSISFVVDLGDGSVAPEKRTITYDAAARTLSETRFAGTSSGGTVTFGAATSYGSQLSDVGPDGAAPIFAYYAYDTSNPPRPELALGPVLSDAEKARVARITVAFRVGPPAGAVNAKTGATVQDEVLVRSVDPADPVPLPLCS